MSDPHVRLLELARRQRELIADGRYDELAALECEWAAAQSEAPAQTPPEALPLLAEAERLVDGNVAALEAALRATAEELSRLRRGRAAVLSYAGGQGISGVDERG